VSVDEKRMFEEFEKKGEQQVHLLVDNHRFNLEWEMAAIKWRAAKAQETNRLGGETQAEQTEIARAASKAAERSADAAELASAAAERQATAAERANTRATIALVVAIISIFATAISVWISHSDSTRSGGQSPTSIEEGKPDGPPERQ
jgi:hypothetical protein